MKPPTLYTTYRKDALLIAKGDFSRTLSFDFADRRILLRETCALANRYTVIRFEGEDTVIWEQAVPFGGRCTKTRIALTDSSFREKGAFCILLIRGKPARIDAPRGGIYMLPHGSVSLSDERILVLTEEQLASFSFA